MDKEILYAFIRTLVALPLVLGLAYLVIKYGLARKGSFYHRGESYMQVLEQLPMGPKGMLSLVQVGKNYLLLAQTESGMVVLEKWDALPEKITIQPVGENLPDFRQILQSKFKGKIPLSKQKSEGDKKGES